VPSELRPPHNGKLDRERAHNASRVKWARRRPTERSGVHTPSGLRSTINRPLQCTREAKPVAVPLGAMNGATNNAGQRAHVYVHVYVHTMMCGKLIPSGFSGWLQINAVEHVWLIYCCWRRFIVDAVCARRRIGLFDKGLCSAILLHTMDQRPLIKTREQARAARTHTDKSAAQIAPCHRRIRNENHPPARRRCTVTRLLYQK